MPREKKVIDDILSGEIFSKKPWDNIDEYDGNFSQPRTAQRPWDIGDVDVGMWWKRKPFEDDVKSHEHVVHISDKEDDEYKEMNVYAKRRMLVKDEDISNDVKKKLAQYLPGSSKHVKPVSKAVTPANYDALQVHGHFGLIDLGKGVYNEREAILHTPHVPDRRYLLNLQSGDDIDVVFLRKQEKGRVNVRYVTRSRYFSPGTPVTSVRVGLDGWD
jgi:hypothetical protein